MSENKKVKFSVDGTKLNVSLDLDQDGKPSASFMVDIAEMPSEVWAAVKDARSKKSEGEASES